jgi:hypothetical protein
MQLLVSLLLALAFQVNYSSTACLTEKDTFKPGKVQIIGLSRDTVERQKLFAEKEKLTVSTDSLISVPLVMHASDILLPAVSST